MRRDEGESGAAIGMRSRRRVAARQPFDDHDEKYRRDGGSSGYV
jgi:hypothetical protein